MSMHPLPPNPCLIAVILVAKTSSDPFIAFHYPPKPGEDNSRFKTLFRDKAEDSTTSSSDNDSPNSATDGQKADHTAQEYHDKDSPPNEVASASPEKRTPTKPDDDRKDLFGFQSSVLAKVLCPSVNNHKKKFEIALNEKVFIGRPVFAKTDGTWKKAKKARRLSSRSNLTSEITRLAREEMRTRKAKYPGIEEEDHVPTDQDTSAGNPSDAYEKPLDDDGASAEDKNKSDEALQEAKRSSNPEKTSKSSKKSLAMFNLVCVVAPPPLEYHLRVREMYEHVVRKFSKALKWEQAHSHHVGTEVASIVSITKRAEQQSLSSLYLDLMNRSSLARAIASLFNSISSSRIAHISLTPSLSLSLQIPIPTSISVLPSAIEPQLPGLWLTTANSIPMDDEAQTTGSQLGSHFTLLLLSDLHTILADVTAADSPITEPLTHYLRVSKPTKSFFQISQSSGILLPDIQFLASHLIYWRRARAIPPLHQRDTYIVSPNADMLNLAAATSTFAKIFPALPSLPQILSTLSTRLRPYASLIPSKDHKEAYMDILAWLMRGGWVTQLRTFAWVRVPGHIKDTVSIQTRVTEANEYSSASGTDDSIDEISKDDSDAAQPKAHQNKARGASSQPSTHNATPASKDNPVHPPASLIANPRLASDIPSRHLSAISDYVFRQKGDESQAAWDRCVKYFDGRHAIETIPMREDWKRKKVKELVDGWVELGVLVRGRHW